MQIIACSKKIFKQAYLMVLGALMILALGAPENSQATSCTTSDACGFGQVCSNGVCVDSSGVNCTPKSTKQCYDHNVYWYDSCGVRGEKFQDCGLDSYLSEYKCSSSMVQQKVVARGCDAATCKELRGWVDLQNCAEKGLVCRDGACRAGDATPPLLYYLLPSGTVTSPSAILSLTTSETAECRYGYYDVGYDQMGMRFSTTDNLHHTVSVTLSNAGAYVFYVRCRDTAGNTNLSSSKISFTYTPKSGQTVTGDQNPAKDTTPPVIESSSLLPTGKVETGTVELSLKTNEKASCRYDIADTTFTAMENSFDADTAGKSHTKTVTLAGQGRYAYYVRCKDASGNASTQSSLITFDYAAKTDEPAFTVSEGKPAGTVYQKAVALEVATSSAASCRYSVAETDFDSMEDLFSTTDGLQHMAVVTLADYGNYSYNVGCRDSKDATRSGSTQIAFEYKDANATEPTVAPPTGDCKTMTKGAGDGKCTPVKNCVCDPDCPGSGNQADPDCAGVPKDKVDPPVNWVMWAAIVIVVAVVVALALIKKRSGGGGDEDGGEDESLGL